CPSDIRPSWRMMAGCTPTRRAAPLSQHPKRAGRVHPVAGPTMGDTNGPGHNLGVLVLITEANVSITDTEKIVELSEVHHERVRTRQHRPGVRVEDQTRVSIS